MITSKSQQKPAVWGTDLVQGNSSSLANARRRELAHFYPKQAGKPITPAQPIETIIDASEPSLQPLPSLPVLIPQEPTVDIVSDSEELIPLYHEDYIPHHQIDDTEIPQSPTEHRKSKRRGLGVMLGFGAIMASITVALGVLWVQINDRPPTTQENLLSVFTQEQSYRVLILPFQASEHIPGTLSTEQELQAWINATPEKESLQLEAAYISATNMPQNAEAAKRIGEVYEADIVLWGANQEVSDGTYHLKYASVRREYHGLSTSDSEGLGRQATDNVYTLGEGSIAGTKDDIVNLLLAIGQLREEKYQAAYSNLQMIPQYTFTEMATVHHLLAVCYAGMEHFDESLYAYRAAIEATPQAENLLAHQASLLLQLEKPEAALASFDQALALNPWHLDAKSSRTALLNSGKVLAIDTNLVLQDAIAMKEADLLPPAHYFAP